jgi:two-component system, NarL family, response regulator DegU
VLAVARRTLIIGNQALFTKALGHMLSLDSAFEVVGDADAVTEAVVGSTRPHIIIIDIDSKIDLVEAVQISRGISPDVRICALSMHLQPDVMQRCLSAGVDGYIVKDITPNEFLQAIKSVAAGETYLDSRLAGRLIRRGSSRQHSDLLDLSNREVDVVRLIVAGMSNKEIGGNLHLSEKTVKNHVSRIFTKFNCTARTQAAVYAMRVGLA